MALINVLRFVGASFSAPSLFNDLLQYPLYGDLLFTMCGFSRYFADVLVREPALFRWLTSTDALGRGLEESSLDAEIGRVLGTFARAEKRLDALKRLQRRELLRIGARDILGLADLASVTGDLSSLADAMIGAVLGIVADQLKDGALSAGAERFCVIGLGKLGGRELNYSSDVDIIFVYADTEDSGAVTYFNRLAERLIQALSQPSAEGHFYRVDTRLRPESGAGPLALSLNKYCLHYESHGELWERQMLIKARVVAGDRELGDSLLRQLEPFVYPRTFLEDPASSVARIKARIEAAVGDEANIKLMAGGIRDIEFVAQTLQLINGGSDRRLRSANTLTALAELSAKGLLDPEEHRALARAYELYRKMEHRLQMVLNTQTHTLPSDAHAFEALARRCGLPSANALRSALDENLHAVRRIFAQVLSTPPAPAGIEAAIEGGLDDAGMIHAMKAMGFRDLRTAARNVRLLSRGSTSAGAPILDARTRGALRAVSAELFSAMMRTADPDLTLSSLAILAGAQKIPRILYDQLQLEGFRKIVLDVCAISPRLTRALASAPMVLETIGADPGALLRSARSAAPRISRLESFKAEGELWAGLRHVLGFSDPEQLGDELSAVASGVVSCSTRASIGGAGRSALPLAVFALGKFGTSELGFDGDLDLLFLSGDVGDSMLPALENAAAAVLQGLSVASSGTHLYEADVRLRPEGRSAPLVVEAGAYARYLSTRASLWERQSLTRLRFVAGDAAVGSYVNALVVPWVYQSPLKAGWTGEIVSMRRAMETRSRTRGGSYLDLKLGPGGMADVEFVVQMIQMKYGGALPELRGAKVGRLLHSNLGAVREAGDVELLSSAYRMYRRLEVLMRLALEERGWLLPEGDKLDLLARLYDGSSSQALESRVASTMKRVRKEFLKIAERLS